METDNKPVETDLEGVDHEKIGGKYDYLFCNIAMAAGAAWLLVNVF